MIKFWGTRPRLIERAKIHLFLKDANEDLIFYWVFI